jgi:lysozyme
LKIYISIFCTFVLISSTLVYFFNSNSKTSLPIQIKQVPIKKDYPIKGIDISHYQGKINWRNISAQGIRFVYIKASQGINFQDKRFQYNWTETKKNKIPRGAYHFFDLCASGKLQAKNFIRTVSIDDSMLPPVVDLELFKNCIYPPSKEKFLIELKLFTGQLEARYKKKPMLYIIWNVYEKYLIGEMKDHPLWISDPWKHEEPALPEKKEWILWQYTYEGRVKGISGYVDWNYFYAGENEFEKWINNN